MSYIALYRKYRPLTFKEVVGQKHIVATIQSAINNNKVAHAYLLCGPRGTGKTTVARIIAKAVNCEAVNKPCAVCPSCLEIQEGNHPDIVEIDAASNNGVEEIRDLVEKVKYAPLSAKYKVYIIDEVHMLSQSAFNALLKTLEDPPSHVLFILATTEAHKVIPTIISRCQRFDFARVDLNSLAEKMKEIVKKEDIKYEEGLLEEIALLAEGGMRDALSTLDQLATFCGDYLDIASLHKTYGLLSNEEKVGLIASILEQNINEILTVIEKVNSQGLNIRILTNELIELTKECIVYGLTKNPKFLSRCNEEQAKLITASSDNDQLFELTDLFMDSAEKYRNAANGALYFETCLLKALNITEKRNSNSPVAKAKSVADEKEVAAVKPTETIVETMNEPTNIVSEVNEDEEYLLSLLLRASKDYKAELSNVWDDITTYCSDVDLMRGASALKQSEIFAAGEDFVMVRSNFSEIVKQLNNEQNAELNVTLMRKLSNKPRKVFALEMDYSNHLADVYRGLKTRIPPLAPAAKLEFKEDVIETGNPLFEIFGKDGVEIID